MIMKIGARRRGETFERLPAMRNAAGTDSEPIAPGGAV